MRHKRLDSPGDKVISFLCLIGDCTILIGYIVAADLIGVGGRTGVLILNYEFR
jgi:hypothetical protein